MSYLAPIHVIGGNGGNPFDFNGIGNGATLKNFGVWISDRQIKAIKVSLTDGQSKQFGQPAGNCSEFTVEDGEYFSSLSLWDNGAGSRLGGIKFRTNRGREFFVRMAGELKKECPVDVGSGICIGITGRSGTEIEGLGFKFINTINSIVLTNVEYPTLNSVKPNVAVEEIKCMTHQNNASNAQDYILEASQKITRKSSWSVSNKLNITFSTEVVAGIPEVKEVSTGFGLTVGTESFYRLESSEENTEQFLFSVIVPPWKTMDASITVGRATVDLPYNGTVQVVCYNGSVLQFPTSGTYKGIAYTDAKVVVKESTKKL